MSKRKRNQSVFRLFKNSGIKFGELLKVIADKGYQGINKIHQLSETPIKKPKGKKLTKEQKKYNRELNRLRITVEHVNRRLKIFKILSDRVAAEIRIPLANSPNS